MGFDMLNDLFIVLSTELCVVPESQILWVDHYVFSVLYGRYIVLFPLRLDLTQDLLPLQYYQKSIFPQD